MTDLYKLFFVQLICIVAITLIIIVVIHGILDKDLNKLTAIITAEIQRHSLHPEHGNLKNVSLTIKPVLCSPEDSCD